MNGILWKFYHKPNNYTTVTDALDSAKLLHYIWPNWKKKKKLTQYSYSREDMGLISETISTEAFIHWMSWPQLRSEGITQWVGKEGLTPKWLILAINLSCVWSHVTGNSRQSLFKLLWLVPALPQQGSQYLNHCEVKIASAFCWCQLNRISSFVFGTCCGGYRTWLQQLDSWRPVWKLQETIHRACLCGQSDHF